MSEKTFENSDPSSTLGKLEVEDFLMPIRKGRVAQEELYKKTRRELLPLLERMIPPRLKRHLDSEDLFSESFLRSVVKLDTFRGEGPNAWRNYVLKTAKNCILDADKRKAALDVALEYGDRQGGVRASRVPDKGPRASQAVRDREFIESVFSGLRRSDERLLRLKLVEGLGDEDIARRIGKKPEAVRKALQRAKQRFARLAQDLDSSRVDESSRG